MINFIPGKIEYWMIDKTDSTELPVTVSGLLQFQHNNRIEMVQIRFWHIKGYLNLKNDNIIYNRNKT